MKHGGFGTAYIRLEVLPSAPCSGPLLSFHTHCETARRQRASPLPFSWRPQRATRRQRTLQVLCWTDGNALMWTCAPHCCHSGAVYTPLTEGEESSRKGLKLSAGYRRLFQAYEKLGFLRDNLLKRECRAYGSMLGRVVVLGSAIDTVHRAHFLRTERSYRKFKCSSGW